MRTIFSRPRHGYSVSPPLFDPRKLRLEHRYRNQGLIRRFCASAYLGNQTAICRVLGRYKMFVDTTDVGLSPHLLLDGYWEMWLTEVLVQVLKPGMVAVDVGANLGYFTLLMAEQVGAAGAVHAFEPNPPIADRLTKSIDVNGFQDWVSVHREPLSREDGLDMTLAVPLGEPKNAHITTDFNAMGAVAVRTRRFDSYPELLSADVVKIDAEGAERDIWQGMSGLFDQSRRPLTIFLEFMAARYADPAGFLAEIQGRGFSLGEVTLVSGVRRRTVEEILAAPALVDQMLILRR